MAAPGLESRVHLRDAALAVGLFAGTETRPAGGHLKGRQASNFVAFDADRFSDLYPFTGHVLDRGGLRYHYLDEGVASPGDKVVLSGFGVGLSWGTAILEL